MCGRARIDGEDQTLCTPLLNQPVRLARRLGSLTLTPAGDRQLTPLVASSGAAAHLEAEAEFGGGALFDTTNASDALIGRLSRLRRWIDDVVGAAGLPPPKVLGPDETPLAYRDHDDLVAVVGTGLFASRDVTAPGLGPTLRSWAATDGIGRHRLRRGLRDHPCRHGPGRAASPRHPVAPPAH